MGSLLIIDDDHLISAMLRSGLQELKVNVLTAATAAEGLAAVARQPPDAIMLDIGLPDMSGLDLFQRIHQIDSRIPVIMMTGQGTTETAISAMKLGAYDYIPKPFPIARVRGLILQALEIGRQMRVPVLMPHEAVPADGSSEAIVGRSPAMQEVYKLIGRMAPQNGIVLIRGESGTGKELVARAIYQHSRRPHGPFLAINCAAIPESLLESELFGHEKGAFTGADRTRIGKFEQCNGGTLFLDEIGDMPPLTQTKILRVMQDQEFERVGGTATIRTDVRLIAATHRNLEDMVATGRFRSDLYYRLNVFTLNLPALRQRTEDLPLLVDHFLRRFSRDMGRDVKTIAPEALDILKRYPWPGNIRELQSVLRQALLYAAGPVLLPEFLPASVRSAGAAPEHIRTEEAPRNEAAAGGDWDKFIDERLQAGGKDLYAEWTTKCERHLITRVLKYTDGNQLRAAAVLGITRRSLRNKLRALGISVERSVISAEDSDDGEERSEPVSEGLSPEVE